MYLFIWLDGQARQVKDNLTVDDYLAVAQRLISVYRIRKSFEKLVIDNGKACWVPVKESQVANGHPGRFHF